MRTPLCVRKNSCFVGQGGVEFDFLADGARRSFQCCFSLRSNVVVTFKQRVVQNCASFRFISKQWLYLPYKKPTNNIVITPKTEKMMKVSRSNPLAHYTKPPSSPPPPPHTHPSISETDNGPLTNLENEKDRLQTFLTWRNPKIKPEALAKAGFYFLQQGDSVRCPFCKVEGGHWEEGDDPLSDHRKWSPRCRFINGLAGGEAPTGGDVCGSRDVRPETEDDKMLRRLGIEKQKMASHQQYASVGARLKSFEDWPKSLKQTAPRLSDAGFFYKGVGDQTVCFHCGGGLKDWEDSDDPWEQHACWFPSCNYLLLKKGKEYVEEVQRQLQPGGGEVKEAAERTKVGVELKSGGEKSEANDEDENSGRLCKICYKNELGVVFIPCGHVVACVDCSLSLNNVCPVCRKHFDVSVRAFLS